MWIVIEQVNPDHDLLWPAHKRELVVGLLSGKGDDWLADAQEVDSRPSFSATVRKRKGY